MAEGAIQAELRQFASDRDWGQFHTPRSLILALVGEVGSWQSCISGCRMARMRSPTLGE